MFDPPEGNTRDSSEQVSASDSVPIESGPRLSRRALLSHVVRGGMAISPLALPGLSTAEEKNNDGLSGYSMLRRPGLRDRNNRADSGLNCPDGPPPRIPLFTPLR